jgi:hypothetical protein
MFSAVKKKMNGEQENFGCYIEKNGFGLSPEPTGKWIKLSVFSRKADFHRVVAQFRGRTASPLVKF